MSNLPTELEDFGVSSAVEEQEHSLVDASAEPTEAQLINVETEQKQDAPRPVGRPRIKPIVPRVMSAAAFVAQAKETDAALYDAMNSQQFNPLAGAQVLPKDKAPIKPEPKSEGIDWTKVSQKDIADMSIPIEARPFSTEDSLTIDLKDKNYEPRWVNKNPIILGKALASGFTYVTEEDLARPLDVAILEDVNGRYLNLDVIAMKCPKITYFGALRACFLRAVNTVNSLSSKKAAKNQAMTQLIKDAGAGVAEEFESGKVSFYDASGIEI
jgi:hypothetical protein